LSPEGPYHYRAEVLAQLRHHGVQPTEHTRPSLVHEFVSDLYRHELRRLRDRLLRKEFPKPEYYGRVVELRKRYWLISMRPDELLERPRFIAFDGLR
jgi:hypothetical protein